MSLRISTTDAFVRVLEFYDFEANPRSLAGWSARLRIRGPLDGTPVVVNTTAGVTLVTGKITYALAAGNLAQGVYEYELEYTDDSGLTKQGERDILYVDGGLA